MLTSHYATKALLFPLHTHTHTHTVTHTYMQLNTVRTEGGNRNLQLVYE